MVSISQKINELPLGYSTVTYRQKSYSVVKSEFNGGNSVKIYAEELGGNDFISLNFYSTSHKELLKPCEMPKEKVMQFLYGYQPIEN